MPRVLASALVLVVLAGTARAIINPHFTPKHLVEQSEVIFVGAVQPAPKGGEWTISSARTLKGKPPAENVLNLASCKADQVEDVKSVLKRCGKDAVIVFSGTLLEEKRAYLHADGVWMSLKPAAQGRWDVESIAPQMAGTYAGWTDMLIRMCEYLILDEDATVPITAGVRWTEHKGLGKVEGELGGMAAVDFGRAGPGAGAACLFVASSAGDRLYRPDKDKQSLQDVTGQVRLDTRSRRFAFVDADRDGACDLVAWDGQAVTVRLVGPDGTFRAAEAGWTFRLQGDCLALAPCSLDGAPGVLVSTSSLPVFLKAQAGGWKALPLPEGKDASLGGKLGRVSACIVADLDGDGFVDVLQPGESAGRTWRGSAGGFQAPVESPVCTRGGACVATVADFSGDGCLDIFLGGENKNTLWENDGKGGFADVFNRSGSTSYKCPAEPSDVRAVDLNHDGRQDLCLTYLRSDLLYHWNRGFRCFGEEGEVRLANRAQDAGQERIGQKALAAGDFNGDGSDDLAVAHADGLIEVYFNDEMDSPGVRLRLAKGATGPVTVSLWRGSTYKVCLGAAAVAGHSPATALWARFPGECTVRFRLPGGQAQDRKVKVADGPAEVVLEAPGGEKKP